MMSMETTMTSGKASLMDQNIKTIDFSLVGRQIGLMSQHETGVEELTVSENLQFMARVKGLTEKEFTNNKKLILEQLELTKLEHVYARNLSAGNKRKLSLAMSLLVTPTAEFLDDPLNGVSAS